MRCTMLSSTTSSDPMAEEGAGGTIELECASTLQKLQSRGVSIQPGVHVTYFTDGDGDQPPNSAAASSSQLLRTAAQPCGPSFSSTAMLRSKIASASGNAATARSTLSSRSRCSV